MTVAPQSNNLLFVENSRLYVSHTCLQACKQLPTSVHSHKTILKTRVNVCLVMGTTRIRHDGGANHNVWGHMATLVVMSLICMLEMSSYEERVQDRRCHLAVSRQLVLI